MDAKLTPLPANKLVHEERLYPRAAVNEEHIVLLSAVLQSGGTLPAPVVEEKTLRVVDGWHRVKAWQCWKGSTAAIPCLVRRYPSEAALFLDAVLLNAKHGQRLTTADQARCVQTAATLEIAPERLALNLSLTVEVLTGKSLEPANQPPALSVPRTADEKRSATMRAKPGQSREELLRGAIENVYYYVEHWVAGMDSPAIRARLGELAVLIHRQLEARAKRAA